ncbi:9311_t:CDS:2 [Acaulospora colombiana]|uniref:9311_t:CDS:1 n=1 Tax=Acaulospora colombiana TaxID=27376 RepID=A0ACA9K7P1_9GLOM|nr:9311_t:CDS:2 [Acaulospora colombiana]
MASISLPMPPSVCFRFRKGIAVYGKEEGVVSRRKGGDRNDWYNKFTARRKTDENSAITEVTDYVSKE